MPDAHADQLDEVLDELQRHTGTVLDQSERSWIHQRVAANGRTAVAALDAFSDITGIEVDVELPEPDQAGDKPELRAEGEEAPERPPDSAQQRFEHVLGVALERLAKDRDRPLLRSERKALWKRAADVANLHRDPAMLPVVL